jgi:hypothetical protein
MSNDILAYLADKIRDEAQVILADLATGRAKDYAEYKHSTGVLRGLDIADSLVRDLIERMEKDDD